MTEIIVQKFGGTSVGSVERIDAVAEIIKEASKSKKIIVVVSAMGGETNRLVKLAKHFDKDPDKREFDALVSTGETVSSALLAMALQSKGIKARSYSASQISMRTTDSYSKAKILDVDADKILSTIKDDTIPIITGFQGVTAGGDVTTLGRGGSDTTAVAIAAQVGAKRCDIYTDVDGIFTTDPKVVPNAKKLDSITMEEMLELASQGAKVMQTRAVEFANKYNVPVRVLSSFNDGSGTLISQKDESMENSVVSGIAFQKDQVKFTLHGVGDTPGTAFKILGPISDAEVEVDVIVQNVSVDGKTDFTFTVASEDQDAVNKVIETSKNEVQYKDLIVNSDIAKVSLVGAGMRSQTGVASRAFKALSENDVNIQIICTSEIKITMVIDEALVDKAVQVLHEEFELEK
jgi:aspartate kinase